MNSRNLFLKKIDFPSQALLKKKKTFKKIKSKNNFDE